MLPRRRRRGREGRARIQGVEEEGDEEEQSRGAEQRSRGGGGRGGAEEQRSDVRRDGTPAHDAKLCGEWYAIPADVTTHLPISRT